MRLLVPALLLLLALPALAQHEGHMNHGAQPEPARAEKAMAIPDVSVLDQSGRRVNFYSDLVKDRVVVMNFIFTSCTTICPAMGATFSRLQTILGERSDVALISVSVDPVNDTPERLDAWKKKLSAKPGWTLVTGEKADIDRLLKALGVFTADRNDHTPTVLIGDAAHGRWQRASGFATPAKLAELVGTVSKSAGAEAR